MTEIDFLLPLSHSLFTCSRFIFGWNQLAATVRAQDSTCIYCWRLMPKSMPLTEDLACVLVTLENGQNSTLNQWMVMINAVICELLYAIDQNVDGMWTRSWHGGYCLVDIFKSRSNMEANDSIFLLFSREVGLLKVINNVQDQNADIQTNCGPLEWCQNAEAVTSWKSCCDVSCGVD